MSAQDSTAVLVAGMHRSGTSALAGTMRMLGVSLGENLLAPGSDNPKGYWEHQDAVGIHERLLATLGRRWDDVRPLPAGWLDGDAAKVASAEIRQLILRDFAEAHVWAIKDPRICRFLPLWINVLQQLRIKPVVLLAARRPSEVAASIEARNHWAAPVGEMLWLRHVLEAEAASRSLSRAAVVYDDLLSDPSAAICSAMGRLGVQIPKPGEVERNALARFVDRADRHHAHAATAGDSSAMALLADDAYAALVAIAHGGDAWHSLQDCAVRLDVQWQQSGASIEAVAGMAHQFSMDAASARVEVIEIASKLHAQVQWSEEAVKIRAALQASHDRQSTNLQAVAIERDRTARELEQASIKVTNVQQELALAHGRNTDLLAQYEKLQADHERFVEELNTRHEEALQRANAEAASLDAMIKTIHQSRSWRITKPLRTLAQMLKPKSGSA